MTEMVEMPASSARCVAIPLISDADTGYGNELNVTRGARIEARDVAAIHIRTRCRRSAAAISTARR